MSKQQILCFDQYTTPAVDMNTIIVYPNGEQVYFVIAVNHLLNLRDSALHARGVQELSQDLEDMKSITKSRLAVRKALGITKKINSIDLYETYLMHFLNVGLILYDFTISDMPSLN